MSESPYSASVSRKRSYRERLNEDLRDLIKMSNAPLAVSKVIVAFLLTAEGSGLKYRGVILTAAWNSVVISLLRIVSMDSRAPHQRY